MERIREWPVSERPREKLQLYGSGQLSDAELLTILIGRGNRNRSAQVIARDLLLTFGTLRGVAGASFHDLVSVEGVGLAFYASLQASLEIMRRQLAEPLRRDNVFNRAEDTRAYLISQLKDCQHEVFSMLMLDAQHQLLAYRRMFTGTINSAAVYPRELVRQAISDNAAAIILVHNHPSGIAEPSQADIQLTREVKDAMALIDVAVLDHCIVGGNSVVSLAQRGYL